MVLSLKQRKLTVIRGASVCRSQEPDDTQQKMRDLKPSLLMVSRSTIGSKCIFASSKSWGQGTPEPSRKSVRRELKLASWSAIADRSSVVQDWRGEWMQRCGCNLENDKMCELHVVARKCSEPPLSDLRNYSRSKFHSSDRLKKEHTSEKVKPLQQGNLNPLRNARNSGWVGSSAPITER